MILRSMTLGFAAFVVAQFVNPSAEAVTLDVHGALVNNGQSFYTDTVTFTLPAGFTNPTFTINSYIADDSSVVFLNNAEFSNTGILLFGQSLNGFFSFTALGPANPYTFINNNASASFATLPVDLTSLLAVGNNSLLFYVNNTNNGVGAGFPAGGPSQYAFDATVTFDAAAVPGPMVGAGLPGIVMAVGGLIAWRRRRNQAAA